MTKSRKLQSPASDQSFVAFCRAVGIPLTEAQAVVASVAFDGADVLEEYRDLFGFAGPVAAEARRTIGVLCGRNSGKTSVLCAAYLLWRAVTADLSRLAPGEIAFAPLVAPDRELAKQDLRFVMGTLEDSPLAALIEHQDADSVTLRRPDGKRVCVSVFAATRGGASVRGKSIVGAALDEACFFRDASAVVNDRDIYKALTPRLMSGGAVIAASTPWIQSGLLFDLWKENFGTPDDALVIHAPTDRLRTDDPELLERIRVERENDPDNAAREYDCAWLPQGAGNAFDVDALARSVVEAVEDGPDLTGVFIGGDLGLVNDPSAFIAIRQNGDFIDVLDALEIKPRRGTPLSLTDVLRQAASFCERFGTSTIRVDHHSLPQARDTIERERIDLNLDPASESSVDRDMRYSSMIEAFKGGRVRIPRKLGALTDQLARIVATPKSGGGYRYEAPRREGSHCDAAMALILAAENIFGSLGWGTFDPDPGALASLAMIGTRDADDAQERLAALSGLGLGVADRRALERIAYAAAGGEREYFAETPEPAPRR